VTCARQRWATMVIVTRLNMLPSLPSLPLPLDVTMRLHAIGSSFHIGLAARGAVSALPSSIAVAARMHGSIAFPLKTTTRSSCERTLWQFPQSSGGLSS